MILAMNHDGAKIEGVSKKKEKKKKKKKNKKKTNKKKTKLSLIDLKLPSASEPCEGRHDSPIYPG